MSRKLSVAVVVFTVLLRASDLTACGDKFSLVGRSVGYDKLLKASRPGTVLIYSGSTLPRAFSNGQFGALMEIAGHRQRTAADRPALERSLLGGTIDLVLADPSASGDIADLVRTSGSTVIIPVVSAPSRAQRAALQEKFGFVLTLPADPLKVLDVLDKAMAVKARRDATRHA
jgi:hypothetical protein